MGTFFETTTDKMLFFRCFSTFLFQNRSKTDKIWNRCFTKGVTHNLKNTRVTCPTYGMVFAMVGKNRQNSPSVSTVVFFMVLNEEERKRSKRKLQVNFTVFIPVFE